MKDIPEDEDIPEEAIKRLYEEVIKPLYGDINNQIDKALNDIQKNINTVEDGRLGISKIYYLLALKRLSQIGVEQLTNSQPEKLPDVPIKLITKVIHREIKNKTSVVAVHKEKNNDTKNKEA